MMYDFFTANASVRNCIDKTTHEAAPLTEHDSKEQLVVGMCVAGPLGFSEPKPCQENATFIHSGADNSVYHKKRVLCQLSPFGICHICSCSLANNRMIWNDSCDCVMLSGAW